MIHLFKDRQTLCGFIMGRPSMFELKIPRLDTWVGVSHSDDAPFDRTCESCKQHLIAGTMQPTWYRPMSIAPQDGTRILLHYHVKHYKTSFKTGPGFKQEIGEWIRDGTHWQECFWDADYSYGYIQDRVLVEDKGRWTPWCGNQKTRSSLTIFENDCIGWLPVPGEEQSQQENTQ